MNTSLQMGVLDVEWCPQAIKQLCLETGLATYLLPTMQNLYGKKKKKKNVGWVLNL